jgi:hypothetical protein
MFQKRMQRAAVVLLTAALLLTAPLQAAGWTTREAPGMLETAWGWLVEWVIGGNPAEPAPIPPGEQPPKGDDGGAIDPNG